MQGCPAAVFCAQSQVGDPSKAPSRVGRSTKHVSRCFKQLWAYDCFENPGLQLKTPFKAMKFHQNPWKSSFSSTPPAKNVCESEALEQLLQFFQAAQSSELRELLVITTDAFGACFQDMALWGLARSARLEMPKATIKLVDGPELPQAVRELQGGDVEVRLGGTRRVPRIREGAQEGMQLQKQDAMRDASVAQAWRRARCNTS